MSNKATEQVVGVVRLRDFVTVMARKETTEELYREIETLFAKLVPCEALPLAKKLRCDARRKLRDSLRGR